MIGLKFLYISGMRKLLLTLTSLLSVLSANAWWPQGHSIVVELAKRHIEPATRERIEAILGHDMEEDASWFDVHRRDPELKYAYQWHNFVVDSKTHLLDPNWGYDCGNCIFGLCHIQHLLEHFDSQTPENQALTLRMVLHFVADMHCPAHVWYNGNGYHVQRWNLRKKGYPFGRHGEDVCNFHAVYDRMPEYVHPGMTAPQVAAAIDTWKPSAIRRIQKGTPAEWGKDIADKCAVIYTINPVPDNPAEADGHVVVDANPRIIELSAELTDNCLRMAGYRLAGWLSKYIR